MMAGYGIDKRSSASIGNITTFWRLLHLMVTQHGSHPMGQVLTAFTISVLHEIGYSPTVNELCKVTGLSKSSVSRYVSWQISHGYLDEIVDLNDRRKRYLEPTAKGQVEMRWLVNQLDELFVDVRIMIEGLSSERPMPDAEKILMRMEELTKDAGKHRD